jgi:hypothetical protein
MEAPPFFKRISPNKTSAGMSITGAEGGLLAIELELAQVPGPGQK